MNGTPTPRLVPDRPSDAAIAQAFYACMGTLPQAVPGSADYAIGAFLQFVEREAEKIDAAAPSAEAPAERGEFPFVEEMGPTGKPTGYLLRKDSDTACRDYDLFVSNVRAALGTHYDAEAGLICSIALLVAEHHKAAAPAAPATDTAAIAMLKRIRDWGFSGRTWSAMRAPTMEDVEACILAYVTAPRVTGGREARLSGAQIEAGWQATFSTTNPFCPCDLRSFTKAVRWAERAALQAATGGGDA